MLAPDTFRLQLAFLWSFGSLQTMLGVPVNISNVTRRVRGAIGTAFTWAVGWALLGTALGRLFPLEETIPTGRMLLSLAFFWSLQGVIGGLVFSMLLALDNRRSLSQLTNQRVAMWGVLGALAVPVALDLPRLLLSEATMPLNALMSFCVRFAGMGALCALALVAIARRVQTTTVVELESDADIAIASGTWSEISATSHTPIQVQD